MLIYPPKTTSRWNRWRNHRPHHRDGVTRNKAKLPLLEAEIYAKQRRSSINRIFESKTTQLEPDSQTWVKDNSVPAGLIVVDPISGQYDTHICIAASGVYQAPTGEELWNLVSESTSKTFYMTECQAVQKAEKHPVALTESNIAHGEMIVVLKKKTFTASE